LPISHYTVVIRVIQFRRALYDGMQYLHELPFTQISFRCSHRFSRIFRFLCHLFKLEDISKLEKNQVELEIANIPLGNLTKFSIDPLLAMQPSATRDCAFIFHSANAAMVFTVHVGALCESVFPSPPRPCSSEWEARPPF
jgi:hypothetical protein